MSLFGIKPQSLREVARRVQAAEQQFDPSLREFLDSFYVNPARRQQAIEEQPASIDALHDAYIAAVAEHLARVFELPIPERGPRQRTSGAVLRGWFGISQGDTGCRESDGLSSASVVREQRRFIKTEDVT
jgi:hypothetical protein